LCTIKILTPQPLTEGARRSHGDSICAVDVPCDRIQTEGVRSGYERARLTAAKRSRQIASGLLRGPKWDEDEARWGEPRKCSRSCSVERHNSDTQGLCFSRDEGRIFAQCWNHHNPRGGKLLP
jgi:hypothetical protein